MYYKLQQQNKKTILKFVSKQSSQNFVVRCRQTKNSCLVGSSTKAPVTIARWPKTLQINSKEEFNENHWLKKLCRQFGQKWL